MYEAGAGVPQNLTKAREFYTLGYKRAPTDVEAACFWTALAVLRVRGWWTWAVGSLIGRQVPPPGGPPVAGR
eukprot:533462-Prorocentrum_minimum.AAC.1